MEAHALREQGWTISAIVALLTTPEAARPAVPEPGVIPLRRA
ncbi:MAG: hypothetical protein ACRDS1_16350 [Pseudonocardiaceae bacterium]